jgi:hypothetical protein
MIEIELTGVEEFRSNARRLRGKLPKMGDDAAKACADQTMVWLRTSILTRSLNLKPLSDLYAARKGIDNPILVDTRNYLDSIMVRRSAEAQGWAVDLPTDQLRSLAQWLEFGTRTMPPRPHFRPAADYARSKIAPEVGKVTLLQIAEELAK